jgi:SnoaL-like domain
MNQNALILPLQAEFARAFAEEWIAAWNSHDLELILTHYEEDVELRSPVAQKLLQGDGTVRGKAALREYFELGLKAYPHLRFDLVETLWGIETIVISYVNNVRGSKTAEVMLISGAGKIRGVWANYNQ